MERGVARVGGIADLAQVLPQPFLPVLNGLELALRLIALPLEGDQFALETGRLFEGSADVFIDLARLEIAGERVEIEAEYGDALRKRLFLADLEVADFACRRGNAEAVELGRFFAVFFGFEELAMRARRVLDEDDLFFVAAAFDLVVLLEDRAVVDVEHALDDLRADHLTRAFGRRVH